MWLDYSSTMAFHSLPLPHRHPIHVLCVKRSLMQSISSHTANSSTSLTPWTTHDTKKSVIESSAVLINGLLFLRAVLCGKSQYIAFNSQLTLSSLSPRAPQRMLFLRMHNRIGWQVIIWWYTLGQWKGPHLWSIWIRDQYVTFSLIYKLAVLSRLWWSNGMSVLVSMAICFPPLRHVGWILDPILWSLVWTPPDGDSQTLCWTTEFDKVGKESGVLWQNIQETQKSHSFGFWVISFWNFVASTVSFFISTIYPSHMCLLMSSSIL